AADGPEADVLAAALGPGQALEAGDAGDAGDAAAGDARQARGAGDATDAAQAADAAAQAAQAAAQAAQAAAQAAQAADAAGAAEAEQLARRRDGVRLLERVGDRDDQVGDRVGDDRLLRRRVAGGGDFDLAVTDQPGRAGGRGDALQHLAQHRGQGHVVEL